MTGTAQGPATEERAVQGERAVAPDRSVRGDRAVTGEPGAPGDRGPDDGHLRTGEHTSTSVTYSQEVLTPDEEPERPGRSLVTTSHEVIRRWAEQRDAVPATVDGTEHDDHLGVLRLDFGGRSDRLVHVGWDEWFHAFDVRRLNFIYQEERRDGHRSNFFRLANPDRQDG